MPTDSTIESQVIAEIGKESIQARANKSPWNSSDAPGIGPGMDGFGFGNGSLFIGLNQAADEIRPWSYYPMMRDRQLRAFWKTEAILAGGVYSFSARISALPAKIKGPPRNKKKASDMMHGLDLQKLVVDMLTTDNGFFIERVGPGRADKALNPKLVSYLSVMDSAQVWRTFDPEYPAIYVNPYTGAYHKMHYSRIISGSSCPQPDELARGIGFCAVSRALRFVQIERDIEIFKHEKVGGRFTRAIGLVSGMTAKQFNANISDAKELEDSVGHTRYSGIPWLVAVNQDIKASIVDLATLPDGFDAEKDTETYVKVLALAFGTDVREFWPGQGGGASKADATVQHEKARGKGIADVTSTLEKALNWGVLDALDCEAEFDYTDDAEQMATSQYHFQIITNVSTMQQAGNISTLQGTAILINKGVIDPDVIQSVLDAEDAEPATTEAPYTAQQIPVQMAAALATAATPPQLASPPAAAPNTIGTPPGGIKPPPSKPAPAGKPAPALPQAPKAKPLTPRMATSDMRPAKKELDDDEGYKYSPDQPRAANGQFGSGDGSGSGGAKRITGQRQAQNYTIKQSAKQIQGLTPDERFAVATYTGGLAKTVNSALRKGDTATHASSIKQIDSAINKSTVPESVVVYHGMQNVPASGFPIGSELSAKAYMSTSVDVEVAARSAQSENGGAILEMEVASGSHGVYAGAVSGAKHESELLLSRGMKMHVVSKSVHNGIPVYKVKIK